MSHARWPDDTEPDDIWSDDSGLVALPSGRRIRGRASRQPASTADFALLLGRVSSPQWPSRTLAWRDFRVPTDEDDALDALHEAHHRCRTGQRVEVVCRGGVGRTGTALAALAVLDGLSPDEAVAWVRTGYHPRAIETPGQRRWLIRVRYPFTRLADSRAPITPERPAAAAR